MEKDSVNIAGTNNLVFDKEEDSNKEFEEHSLNEEHLKKSKIKKTFLK